MTDSTSLESLYDPEAFRTHGHLLVDKLTESLTQSLSGEGPARPTQEPEAAVAEWEKILQHSLADRPESVSSLFDLLIAKSIKSHHPQTMGHQVGVTAPISALTEMMGALLDTGNGVFEVGNPATAIERVVIKDLARRLSMGENAGGYLTSGGTLGNLTALLAARQAVVDSDVWEDGNDSAHPFGVLVSEQAHYCIDRAARVMGWGSRGVIRVATDHYSQMRRPELQTAFDKARAEGIQVVAVVGNACTTATGSFDPLEEIADFAREHGIWFHVDAAHGGAVIFSDAHRHLLQGVAHADSVVIDFHKLMLTPALTTAVLFNDEASSFGAFAQQAEYLWRSDDGNNFEQTRFPWQDSAQRTMECTRPMAALRIFALLATQGDRIIGKNVDVLFASAQIFAAVIADTPDVELLTPPVANIVCYRLTPDGLSDTECDAINTESRKRLLAEGNFYFVETKIHGRTWLRSAIMNPFTEKIHFIALLDALKRLNCTL
ncbi:MAG: L-2,4-diaminobutyrate decarboxylase [Verrucomicrobiales bacterium]|jgi:L-2,4-diaminobutyrate decarboxylase